MDSSFPLHGHTPFIKHTIYPFIINERDNKTYYT